MMREKDVPLSLPGPRSKDDERKRRHTLPPWPRVYRMMTEKDIPLSLRGPRSEDDERKRRLTLPPWP